MKLLLLLISVLFTACGGGAEETVETENPPPNVLFIAVDDLRQEIGAYGKAYMHTPNIDRLAARGILFDNAYCNVPVCGASRASIMTGMRPTRQRFVDFKATITDDAPGATTLHGHFKANGYYAVAMGKIIHHPSDHEEDYNEKNWKPGVGGGAGRDYHLPENIAIVKDKDLNSRGPAFERADVADTTYYDGKTAARAVEYIDRLAPKKQPFFLAVGFAKPHLPFNAPAEYWDMYDPATITMPPTYYRAEGTPNAIFHNSGELRTYSGVPKEKVFAEDYARQLIHGYYAAVSYVDAQLGKVLDALEASGEADNTIIVFWGDHGWNLGDHTMWCKHTSFNTSLRVPLIISAPGIDPGRSQSLVEYVDVFPTLAELAGLPLPEQLEGTSQVPVLKNPEEELKDAVFTRWKDADNITTRRYAYTEWYNDEGDRYARVLFDHATDSLEVNNLAEKPEYADLVAELSGRLPIGNFQD